MIFPFCAEDTAKEIWSSVNRNHTPDRPIKTIANGFRKTIIFMTELQSSVKRFVQPFNNSF